MHAKSEGELLHTVKGFLQMIQSNGAGNAEAVCAGAAEHAAGRANSDGARGVEKGWRFENFNDRKQFFG